MNALAKIEQPVGLGDIDDFKMVAAIEAWFVALGIKPKHLAVDHCWWAAERWFLTDQFDVDFLQQIMADEFASRGPNVSGQ